MAGKKGELVNTSEIARRTNINRAVVANRLREKGVKPREQKAKETLYDAAEALSALQGDDRAGLRKAQTMKTAIEASRAKIKFEKEKGELVPIKEARADLQEVVKRIYQHFVVTGPGEIAPRLHRLKSAQIEAALRQDAEQFFNDLRDEFESYLNAED